VVPRSFEDFNRANAPRRAPQALQLGIVNRLVRKLAVERITVVIRPPKQVEGIEHIAAECRRQRWREPDKVVATTRYFVVFESAVRIH